MDNLYLLYFQYIIPSLSVLIDKEIKVEEAGDGVVLIIENTCDLYVDENEITVFKSDKIKNLTKLGSYETRPNFLFFKVLAEVLYTFNKNTDMSKLIDVILGQNFPTWRDLLIFIANCYQLESSPTAMGVVINSIGEFTQRSANTLVFDSTNGMEITYDAKEAIGGTFKQGVLSILGSIYWNYDDFFPVLLTYVGLELEEAQEPEDEFGAPMDEEGGVEMGGPGGGEVADIEAPDLEEAPLE